MSEPNCCPRCLRNYEWETDGPFGIGKIHPVHPAGPCVPRSTTYMADDADDGGAAVTRSCDLTDSHATSRSCIQCGSNFTARRHHGGKIKTCSAKCALERRREYQRGYYGAGVSRIRKPVRRSHEERRRELYERWRDDKQDAA